jgi:diaminohydroxyphosphoribosylaminopyrimidine deaminase/5-amino-6-(5-phosphoribosylamino)uracil reductase
MVGAVIVKDGKALAEGWHRAPGEAHAEVDAIRSLDGSAEGATMYVNLEPCCHQGRTPPCTEAIIAAGIAKVVVGQVDPDARM